MSKQFRDCNLNQLLLLPASLQDWLPEGHLARLMADVVETRLREREKQEEERRRKMGGRPPQAPDPEQAKPEPKAQRNFTDPDSRIMKDGATVEVRRRFNPSAVFRPNRQCRFCVGC